MQSLIFGLGAALCWGLHDILVRHVSQRAGVAPLLAVALVAGSVALAPISLFAGDWDAMGTRAMAMAVASGAFFALANVALYRAFSIGPVRLVAPVIGAYPVLSLAWAAAHGQPVEAGHWLAVLAVIAGIALVARQPGDDAASDNRVAAMSWAGLAALAFALTFALGQIAAREGSELPATLIARLTALALVAGWLAATATSLAGTRAYLKPLTAIGILDVTALGLVLAAGTLPNPEFAAVAASVFGIVTILLAWAILKERMIGLQWVGVGVVFAGIGYLAAG